MNKLNLNKWTPAVLLLFSWVLLSCEKTSIEPTETYPDPPVPLVKFLDGPPSPAIGSEGSLVTFNVNGLKGKEGQFKFLINQTEAEIIAVEENTVKVKVPANASTGGAAVLIDEKYYFGPTFTVRGKVSVDPLFKTGVSASNGVINGIFRQSNGSSYLIYGNFNDYMGQASATNPITGLAVLNADGDYLTAASQLKIGKLGFNGGISSVIQLPDGKYMVAGSFSRFDTIGNINNLTRLNSDGSLETMMADVINPDPVNNPSGGKALVPVFNGGVFGGSGNKIFYDPANGYTTVVGNFNSHVSTFYERSTKDGPYLDRVEARQIIRMNDKGAFDSSFNFDKSVNTSYAGGNGFILDAIQLPDGNLLVAGNFTTFHGKPASYIARISGLDGSLDETFNPGGSGPDGGISRITYNNTTGKILLTGSFKNYNGQPADGVVMINEDGSMDSGFTFRSYKGGLPNYAGQLDNGKILVSGSFSVYDQVVRPGLVILNPDGSLAAGYNNMGLFRGEIKDILELPGGGVPAVFLVGRFDRFDNRQVSNIVKIRIEN